MKKWLRSPRVTAPKTCAAGQRAALAPQALPDACRSLAELRQGHARRKSRRFIPGAAAAFSLAVGLPLVMS